MYIDCFWKTKPQLCFFSKNLYLVMFADNGDADCCKLVSDFIGNCKNKTSPPIISYDQTTLGFPTCNLSLYYFKKLALLYLSPINY